MNQNSKDDGESLEIKRNDESLNVVKKGRNKKRRSDEDLRIMMDGYILKTRGAVKDKELEERETRV